MSKAYRDWIVQLFGRCAYAPTEDAFEMHMRTLKDEGGAVIREFLKNHPKENWSTAYFLGKIVRSLFFIIKIECICCAD